MFGEYLDFHPRLYALVTDGLFTQGGLFHVMFDASLAPLEELFRPRVMTFLVNEGLLLPEYARMLREWTQSGFKIHRSRRVPPGNRLHTERLAQYIIRNPFLVGKMRPATRPNRHFVMRGAPRITKWRALDSQSPIWQRPGMEITASSLKLGADASQGRKAISNRLSVVPLERPPRFYAPSQPVVRHLGWPP